MSRSSLSCEYCSETFIMGKSSTAKVWLAFLLSLTWDSGVGADNFAFSGFEENPLYSVPGSNWTFNTTTDCLHFNYPPFGPSGRFLYPGALQMTDPDSTAVKSFSTSFIDRIDCMAFSKIPDNVTLGAPGDIMGIISSETGKKYEFDNSTLGVEVDTYMNLLDTFMNPEFNDPNENHYFSAHSYKNFSSVPTGCTGSFSNDGSLVPPIDISQDERKKKSLRIRVLFLVSLIVSAGIIICITVSFCWCKFVVSCPLRIFISHAGGPDGSHKNFPTWLDERMRTYRWSVAKSRVRIFFDIEDVEMGKSIAKKISRELARFDVGVVVVTTAFFVAKWPMTELIAFVEAQTTDPADRIRVLPLFYELSPAQVKAHLDGKTWDGNWEDMSKGNHPLQVEKCREAVTWLCQQRGIPYGYAKRNQDKVYIETICKEVDEILCQEKSFASYLIGAVKSYCIPSHSQPGMTTLETEMTLL